MTYPPKPSSSYVLGRSRWLLHNISDAWLMIDRGPVLYGCFGWKNAGSLVSGMSWSNGDDGPILVSDGSANGYVVFSNGPDLPLGQTPRTFFCRVRIDSAKTTLQSFFGYGAADSRQAFTFHFNVHTDDLYLSFNNNDYYTGDNILNRNIWYNLAAVYDGGTLSTSTVHIYVNGVAQSLTKVGMSNGEAATVISAAHLFGDPFAVRCMDGSMSMAALWKRALSVNELLLLHADPYLIWRAVRNPKLAATLSPNTTTAVRLAWADNSEGEDGFSIERDDDGGGFVEIDTVAAGVETYDDSVDIGHTYTYRVRALSAAKGNSEYSNEVEVTV